MFLSISGIIFDVTLKSKHFSVAVRLFSIAISCLPASFTEPEPCSLSSFCFLYWLCVYFSHFVDLSPPTRMLTGCYGDMLSHLILRKKRTQSSTKAEVNCTVGDISQYFQGKEHLWLRVADDKQGSSLSPLVNLYCARMSVSILRHEDWKKTKHARHARKIAFTEH